MKAIIEQLYSGETCFVLGGGPSVKELDLTRIHDKFVIGVNDAYTLGDWVDIVFFGDQSWGNAHRSKLCDFPNPVFTNHPTFKNKEDILCLNRTNNNTIKGDDSLKWLGNSGATAILLAMKLGFTTIILLGFDMKPSENKENNWHPPFRKKPNLKVYQGFLSSFPAVKSLADKNNIKILNANKDSRLKLFDFVNYEEVTQ